MKIQFSSNNISFKKQFEANCSVLNKSRMPEPCFIFKLEPSCDEDYFCSIPNAQDWLDADYLDFLKYEIDRLHLLDDEENELYVMENKFGDCLAFCKISEAVESYTIEVLETAPAYTNKQFDKKVSPLKYIGETFVSFFAALAKNNNKKYIDVVPTSQTRSYYTDQCLFEMNGPTLNSSSFSKLIKKNEKHTNDKILLK